MLELKTRPTVSSSQARAAFNGRHGDAYSNPQPRRLLLALVLLLVALAGVVVKDRQFWFGSEQSLLDSDGAAPVASVKPVAKPVPAAVSQVKSVPAPAARKHTSAAQTSSETQLAAASSAAPAVTATRTVLPPLDVEVVAGDKHSKIHPGSNTTKLEITNDESASAPLAVASNAAERERIADAPQASYPLLAQHMNVQGSVVLQAIIGADGIIQDLHVLSGPAILSSAAQQAVREWRFKPVLQNGQAVETKARITVNFSIKVGENSQTTLAESRTEGIQVLSR
jgi:TonB family protein